MLKYIKQELLEIRGEMGKNTNIVGNCSMPLIQQVM